ncbi:MAG: hypothetical protein HY690_04070 [Chloroflexi bacterium]|nr:hypothetical protein [Chloroflexota bacterium]
MDASETRFPFPHRLLALVSVAILATVACAPQAPAPTAAPAKAPATAAPAQPAPTAAPAKAEAPTAKPAPTTPPAAKPTEKPAAKPAGFDEKAVADFYKGKTIRIVVGRGPGGTTDITARLLQTVLPRYIPGNPTLVVENRPGGGGLLALNTVYNTEPKDGTVIVTSGETQVLQQAIGLQGIQFDAGRYQWLASTHDSPGACAVRTDAGIGTVQEMIASGKEVTVSSYGKPTSSYEPPAVMNAALGTRFKIVAGYESGATQILAVKNKEVDGWCTTFEGILNVAGELLEGTNPVARVLIVLGAEPPKHPALKGVPAAETLAKTDEAKALLKGVNGAYAIQLPYGVAPEVPKDRVEALRRALDKALVDPEFRAGAEKSRLAVTPYTGEQVQQIVQQTLSLPPATLAKLKQVLD